MVHKNTLDFFFNLITLLNLLTNNLVTDSFFFFFFLIWIVTSPVRVLPFQ